ncbi:MAG: ribulose-phosphate 3-epimerase [Synergistaceae bacterium]|jgi:ribulose-phosphate 3-epimerase|nr:ribulose-phosphate 3-epimerase [Synergistaceae bacterium]
MRVLEEIYPSIYSADHLFLHDELMKVDKAGFQELHVDIQDGIFTPNMSFGMRVVDGLRKYTAMRFNVHLMVLNPEYYIQRLKATGGIRVVYFHPSAVRYPSELITEINSMGAQAGCALNPIEVIEELIYYKDKIGAFLVGTAEPDNSGGLFAHGSLQKIRRLRKLFGEEIEIVVDGNINAETLPIAQEAGANRFVVGRALFQAPKIQEALGELENALASKHGAVT